jgi:orotate phosphoribosyltransferase
VVIEDLISTGKSSLAAIDALKKEGVTPIGLTAIFTYEFQSAVDGFQAAACPFKALCNYSVLLKTAAASGYIQNEHIQHLTNWKSNPSDWANSL